MKQVFKFDHKTVIYHGNGQYTVTADHGFILREQGTNSLTATANTRDYSRFEAIANEGQLNTPSNEENQKQKQASETEKKQPKPTKTKKSKKTSAGK